MERQPALGPGIVVDVRNVKRRMRRGLPIEANAVVETDEARGRRVIDVLRRISDGVCFVVAEASQARDGIRCAEVKVDLHGLFLVIRVSGCLCIERSPLGQTDTDGGVRGFIPVMHHRAFSAAWPCGLRLCAAEAAELGVKLRFDGAHSRGAQGSVLLRNPSHPFKAVSRK